MHDHRGVPRTSCQRGGICGGRAQGLPDAAPSFTRGTDGLVCGTGTVTCALGCVAGAPAHCARLIPSHGIGTELYDDVALPIAFTGPMIFNTDTGESGGGRDNAGGRGQRRLDPVQHPRGIVAAGQLEPRVSELGQDPAPVIW